MNPLKAITSIAGKFLGADSLGPLLDLIPSESKKAEAKLMIMERKHKIEQETTSVWNDQEKTFLDNQKSMEGTASDLKQFGVIGKILVLLRGLQRPVIGYGIGVVDYQVFTGIIVLPADQMIQSTFYAVNIVVLISLFGERAVRNVLPMLTTYLNVKTGSKK